MEDVNSSTVWALYGATVPAVRLLCDRYECLRISATGLLPLIILRYVRMYAWGGTVQRTHPEQ